MCGCRGNNSKPVTKTVVPNQTPPRSIVKTVLKNTRNTEAAPARPVQNNNTSGMTKQQRDEERKRRIQLIIKRKNQL